MRRTIFTICTIAMIAPVALAHNGVQNQTVMQRMIGMEQISAASKVLGNMARGRIPFDATAAEAAKLALQTHAADIPILFEENASDPKSEALPAIWDQFDDFAAKAEALREAAAALDVTNSDTLGAGFRAVGASCRSCHSAYRQ